MPNTFHYTDKDGWNGIRSQKDWQFKAIQPKHPDRPVGAYFTDIEPTPANLRTLFKKIRVPKAKQSYVFWFVGRQGLTQWKGGRRREKHIFYSPTDYTVIKDQDRQKYGNATDSIGGDFT